MIIQKIMDVTTEWLKRRERFGAFRFRLTRLLYRLNPFFPELRNIRWDFILKYLPTLKMTFWKGQKVLDIGCVDSLLIYELKSRGYSVAGLDIRDYGVKLPNNIGFFKCNILEELPKDLTKFKFTYIIATSVIELLGTGKYEENEIEQGADRKAFENIHSLLEDDGYFIFSVPVFHWRFIGGRAYTLGNIMKLIQGLFYPFEITQCGGHICGAFVKLLIQPDGTRNLLSYSFIKDKKK